MKKIQHHPDYDADDDDGGFESIKFLHFPLFLFKLYYIIIYIEQFYFSLFFFFLGLLGAT